MSTISAGTTSTTALVNTGDTTGNLVFQTNGTTTAMTIDTSQRVGVGTTSPSTKLHVSAGRTTLSANNEPYALQLNYGSALNGPYLGSPSTDTFVVSTSGGGERMRLDSNGYLGVGTNAPGYPLDVRTSQANATSYVASINTSATNPSAGFLSYCTGVTGTPYTLWYTDFGGNAVINNTGVSGFGSLLFYNTGSERVRIDYLGNLLTGASSTTWNGALVKSAGTISLASGASINLSSSTCGGAIVSIYVTGSGSGGLFYLNYSATSVKLAGDGDTTDIGSNFAVYKNASSHVSTLKNKAGSTQIFSVVVVAGQLT